MRQNLTNLDLRQRIKQAGITHWQLAERAGISPATLSIWLRQELRPMDPRRVKLACVLTMLERQKE